MPIHALFLKTIKIFANHVKKPQEIYYYYTWLYYVRNELNLYIFLVIIIYIIS